MPAATAAQRPAVGRLAPRGLAAELFSERERLATDAEALREILHCHVAVNRRDAIQPAFDALLGIVDDVLPGVRRIGS